MDIRNQPIEADKFYHIYNRGVNGEVIFKSTRNFDFFLKKVEEYLIPVCEIYAYCLLPNHFHFLVRIKSESELESLVKVSNLDKAERGLHTQQNIFSKQFSRLFNSYSQAFNKENGRHGSLIESPFKRKEINNLDYLRRVLIYIHRNPQLHELVEDFRDYNYSSYKSILNNSENFLQKNEIIELFDDKENFIFCHNKELDLEEF
ncbi:MAG: transposase [Moheibacter sp.]